MSNILLIEDNVGYARHVIDLLQLRGTQERRRYHVTHVTSMQDATERLAKSHRYNVVVSNIMLPDSRGRQTVRTITKISGGLPLIFLTDQNVEALAIAAIKQGAQDYLVKGRHDGEDLTRSIRYAVERQRFRSALSEARGEAQESQERVHLLAQQRRQLLDLNRIKGEFVELASHQLRTPASAVKQYLGLILEGHYGDIDSKLFQIISSAAAANERQLLIINDLLKTAQLDSRSYEIHLKPTELSELIEDSLANLRPIFEAKRQTIVFDDTTPLIAHADAVELRLVLENILENASKYSPDASQITIELGKRGKMAHITVQDQGVGIALVNQKRIFDKFTRVDNALSDTVSGSGLGLYLAKRIMRLHHGGISVESKPGQGSSFTLKIPLEAA